MKKKIYIYSIIFFLIDFISKQIIISKVDTGFDVIPNFFRIIKVTNGGGAFSIFDGYVIIFILIALVVFVCLFRYLRNRVLNNFEILSYSLLIGGILGNFVDRILYGGVIDFLSFRIFGYGFPVFNFADCFIVISVVFIFFMEFRRKK